MNYVALGDYVLDIYSNPSKDVLGYYAGGSAWNMLVNLSKSSDDSNCYCIATCGNDWAGNFIINQLKECNIDVTNTRIKKSQTKRFNIIINGSKTKSQLECPYCGKKIWYSNSAFPSDVPENLCAVRPGIVIIDTIKNSIINLAAAFKKKNWFIAVDIGHISHLRYMNLSNLQFLLCNRFDYIQLNGHVCDFLSRKFSCDSLSDLSAFLGSKYLSVTYAEKGADFVYQDFNGKTQTLSCEALSVNVVDPTGAGDAYFSSLLQSIDWNGNFKGSVEKAIFEAAKRASQNVNILGATGCVKPIDAKIIDGDCKICGSFNKDVSKTTVTHRVKKTIETNTNNLLNRTLRALDSNACVTLNNVLQSLQGNILMVGTGGSFAAAVFAAKCINEFHPNAFASSGKPRDVIISGTKKYDCIFLFSYSGKTKDIQSVYNLCVEENTPVYIISKISDVEAGLIYDHNSIISYSTSLTQTKERGFISMAGTLIPMCLFSQIYFDSTAYDFRTFLTNCFEKWHSEFSDLSIVQSLPKRNLIIDIFSGIDTESAAIDLESKFIESGLARVLVHEKKDFSHGRFNIVDKFRADLIIILECLRGAYSSKIYDYFDSRQYDNVLRISSDFNHIWGDLDLLIAAEFFSKAISIGLDYDMARPEYTDEAMTLYHYSRKDLL